MVSKSTAQHFYDNGWNPEKVLFLAIIEQAVKDLSSKDVLIAQNARQWLEEGIGNLLLELEIDASQFKERMKIWQN